MQSNGAINKDVIISIKGLEKSFDGKIVLAGISLEVYKGENVVILGRSGSGKSVLIKIICGLLKPDKGSVNVLGKQMGKLATDELQELRRRIGFSFQNSALYDSMTVRENLEFPLVRNKKGMKRNDIDNAVSTVLKDVGLLSMIDSMPSELSGGQKKRIGVARTLILHPEIMLYDEPTAGLINDVQKKYNTTSIIITHDLTCAKETGNRVAMLLKGKIEREGKFEEVFNTNIKEIKDFYNYNFITENENS